jgi:hypothetical protein
MPEPEQRQVEQRLAALEAEDLVEVRRRPAAQRDLHAALQEQHEAEQQQQRLAQQAGALASRQSLFVLRRRGSGLRR